MDNAAHHLRLELGDQPMVSGRDRDRWVSHCPFQRDLTVSSFSKYVRLQGEPDLGSVPAQPRHDANDP
jgi:hypothetical protein